MVRKGCLTGALQTARRQHKPGYWGVKLGSTGMEKWGQTLEYLYGLFPCVVFIKEPQSPDNVLSQRLLTLNLNLSLLLQCAKEKPGLSRTQLQLQVTDMGCLPGEAPTCFQTGHAGFLMREPFVSTLTSAQPCMWSPPPGALGHLQWPTPTFDCSVVPVKSLCATTTNKTHMRSRQVGPLLPRTVVPVPVSGASPAHLPQPRCGGGYGATICNS